MFYKLGTVKKFTAHMFKITVFKCPPLEERTKINDKPKCSVNDEKLSSNMARSKSKVYELAMCNEWQHFFTVTLDKNKYDRFDLNKFQSDLSRWLRNSFRKHKIKIPYLYMAENHKDGAWHVHGLLNGLPEEHLTEFIQGKHPQRLIDAGYKNWPAMAEKFGYVTIDKVKNKRAVSAYITKYISKSMAARNTELNAHLFYASKGLKKAELIKKGTMSDTIAPDYENDYVKVQWVHHQHIALAHFN